MLCAFAFRCEVMGAASAMPAFTLARNVNWKRKHRHERRCRISSPCGVHYTTEDESLRQQNICLSLPNILAFFLSGDFHLKITNKSRILVEVRENQSYLRSTVSHWVRFYVHVHALV